MSENRIKITGQRHLQVKCTICGEPIIQSNEFGMYCKNMCGLEDDKKAKKQIEKLLEKWLK